MEVSTCAVSRDYLLGSTRPWQFSALVPMRGRNSKFFWEMAVVLRCISQLVLALRDQSLRTSLH